MPMFPLYSKTIRINAPTTMDDQDADELCERLDALLSQATDVLRVQLAEIDPTLVMVED